jgi:predicted transcriptional regulator
MHRKCNTLPCMKSSTLPSVRVEPELRDQVESILLEDESLSEFVEASVRDSVNRRLAQAEFIKRGLKSLQEAKRTGEYVSVDSVVENLRTRLAKARALKADRKRSAG